MLPQGCREPLPPSFPVCHHSGGDGKSSAIRKLNHYTEQVAARICLSQNIPDWIFSSGFCTFNQWTTEAYLLDFFYRNAVSLNVIGYVLGPKQLARDCGKGLSPRVRGSRTALHQSVRNQIMEMADPNPQPETDRCVAQAPHRPSTESATDSGCCEARPSSSTPAGYR